ncbi:MAG: ABC transporter permease, partial [Bdellovibrionales bacterium]|nr:ABC transporter permease [Bdellovibrionales bacterium]
KRSGALVKTISWISIGSVTVGVAGLILVTSIMNGFNETIRTRMFGVEPHIVIEPKVLGEEGAFQIQELSRELKKNHPEFISVAEVSKQDVILRTYEGLFGGAVVKGYPQKDLKDFFQRVDQLNSRKPERRESAEASQTEFELGTNEVAVGVDLARKLEIFEGDEILLIPPESLLLPPGVETIYQKVKVASIIYTRLANIDSTMIFFNKDKGLPFLQKASSLKNQIELRLPQPTKVQHWLSSWKSKNDFIVSTWETRNEALFFALRLEKISMTTFLSLAVLITGFSIVSALVLLISQKSSDFGILMTMGMSAANARKLFSGIGFILAGSGIVVGRSIGIILSLYLQYFPPDVLPSIYYDQTIPARVYPWTVLVVLGVSLLFAWIGTSMPVRSLLKMSPTEALRR